MANYTFMSAPDGTQALSFRGGALVLGLGQYADLTSAEYSSVKGRYTLLSGIAPGAIPAGYNATPVLSGGYALLGSDGKLGGPNGSGFTSIITSVIGSVSKVDGGVETSVSVSATTSSTTINIGNGNVQTLTLTVATTLTFTGATPGKACSISLYIIQDGTGGHALTWPTIKWPGGAAPTLTTTANAIDLVVLETLDGGTTWYGSLSGAAFA